MLLTFSRSSLYRRLNVFAFRSSAAVDVSPEPGGGNDRSRERGREDSPAGGPAPGVPPEDRKDPAPGRRDLWIELPEAYGVVPGRRRSRRDTRPEAPAASALAQAPPSQGPAAVRAARPRGLRSLPPPGPVFPGSLPAPGEMQLAGLPAPERPRSGWNERPRLARSVALTSSSAMPWRTWAALVLLIVVVGCSDPQSDPRLSTPSTAGRITGRVFDQATGREVSGAFVSIEAGRSSFQTLSAPDGTYLFEAVPEGRYRLSVDAGGFLPRIQHVDLNPKILIALDVGLRPAADSANLVGVVLDGATGARVSNALISIPAASATTVTDVSGRFSLPGIDAGELTLDVQAVGFAPFAARVALPAGATVLETFRLIANAGSISGTLISTRPTAPSAPLAGALVRLLAPTDVRSLDFGFQRDVPVLVRRFEPNELRPSGVAVRFPAFSTAPISLVDTGIVTRTGADGRYRLDDVTAGVVGLIFTADSHDDTLATTIVNVGRETRLDLEMRFNRATVRGTVTDLSGLPVEGALVSVPEQGLTTRTNAVGDYAFDGLVIVRDFPRIVSIGGQPVLLPPRTTSLGALAPGFNPGSAAVALVPGGTVVLDFVLGRATGTLTGVVRRNSDGSPLPGSVVSLPQLGLTTPASADGSFEFPLVPAAFLRVTADSVGFISATTFVTVLPNQTSFAELRPVAPGSLTGVVRASSTGAPVVAASVTLRELLLQTQTDSSGVYRFAELTPGTFQLDVRSLGALDLSTTVTVVEGQTTTRDLTIVQ